MPVMVSILECGDSAPVGKGVKGSGVSTTNHLANAMDHHPDKVLRPDHSTV